MGQIHARGYEVNGNVYSVFLQDMVGLDCISLFFKFFFRDMSTDNAKQDLPSGFSSYILDDCLAERERKWAMANKP